MTNGRLFGSDKKPPKVKEPDPYPGAGQRLIALYYTLYQQRYRGERPVVEPRAAAQLKKIINEQGPEKTEARLRYFMQWNEPFVVDTGHALSVFPSQWNKITAILQKQKVAANIPNCNHVPMCLTPGEHSRKDRAALRQTTDPATMEPLRSPNVSCRTTLKRSEAC